MSVDRVDRKGPIDGQHDAIDPFRKWVPSKIFRSLDREAFQAMSLGRYSAAS
jgi:hypothetical protein